MELIRGVEERGVAPTVRLIFPLCQTFNHDRQRRGADVQRLQIEPYPQTKKIYTSQSRLRNEFFFLSSALFEL